MYIAKAKVIALSSMTSIKRLREFIFGDSFSVQLQSSGEGNSHETVQYKANNMMTESIPHWKKLHIRDIAPELQVHQIYEDFAYAHVMSRTAQMAIPAITEKEADFLVMECKLGSTPVINPVWWSLEHEKINYNITNPSVLYVQDLIRALSTGKSDPWVII